MRPPETRHSLILHLAGEHQELAWREFLGAYEPFLQRLARRKGVPERLIPDVTQQILISIAGSVQRWQDDGRPASFRRWMHQVTRNAVIKFMIQERKQIAGGGGTEFLTMLSEIPAHVDPALERAYEFELITWAAEQVRSEFQESSWKAFWETAIRQRPIEDVCRELNVSPGSVYMSRSRVIARIREKIKRLEHDDHFNV